MKNALRTLTPRLSMVVTALLATVVAGLSTAAPAGATTSSTNLMNVESRLCMGVSGNNFFSGAPIIMWDCGTNHADQYWTGIPAYQSGQNPDKGYVMIQNAEHSNYCLAAPFNGEPYSQQLIIEPCNQQDAHQWWDVYYAGVGRGVAAVLTNEATSRVAQAHEPNQDGAPVIQEPYFGGASNQEWYA